jgi:hypothetical protein
MKRTIVVGSVTVLLALGLSCFLVPSAVGEPDGLPSVTGVWQGKVKAKSYETISGGENVKASMPLLISIVQNGATLNATLTVTTDTGIEDFEMRGYVGNGHLWLAGETGPEQPISLIGHLNGKATKIRGTGLKLGLDADEVVEFKVKVKRQD